MFACGVVLTASINMQKPLEDFFLFCSLDLFSHLVSLPTLLLPLLIPFLMLESVALEESFKPLEPN